MLLRSRLFSICFTVWCALSFFLKSQNVPLENFCCILIAIPFKSFDFRFSFRVRRWRLVVIALPPKWDRLQSRFHLIPPRKLPELSVIRVVASVVLTEHVLSNGFGSTEASNGLFFAKSSLNFIWSGFSTLSVMFLLGNLLKTFSPWKLLMSFLPEPAASAKSVHHLNQRQWGGQQYIRSLYTAHVGNGWRWFRRETRVVKGISMMTRLWTRHDSTGSAQRNLQCCDLEFAMMPFLRSHLDTSHGVR